MNKILTKYEVQVRDTYLWSKAKDLVQVDRIVDNDLVEVTVIIPSMAKKLKYRKGARLLVYISDLRCKRK